jgi:hypothetical protein
MSASRTAVKLGIVMVATVVAGALLLGAVERVRDASDRAT